MSNINNLTYLDIGYDDSLNPPTDKVNLNDLSAGALGSSSIAGTSSSGSSSNSSDNFFF